MCGEYTDYTRSYHHPGAKFWVGSSRNWSFFLERPNTGRHEKAPVRCPCSRLAALHVAPRTPYNGRTWYVCVWHSTNNLRWYNLVFLCLTFNKQPTMVEPGISVLDIQQTSYNCRTWYVCVWHSANNLQW